MVDAVGKNHIVAIGQGGEHPEIGLKAGWKEHRCVALSECRQLLFELRIVLQRPFSADAQAGGVDVQQGGGLGWCVHGLKVSRD